MVCHSHGHFKCAQLFNNINQFQEIHFNQIDLLNDEDMKIKWITKIVSIMLTFQSFDVIAIPIACYVVKSH